MEDILLYFACKYGGQFHLIYKAIEQKEMIDVEALENYKKRLRCEWVTILSDNYPKRLKEINSPPFVLFYYGDLSILDHSTIGVVGMRHPTNYGITNTKQLVSECVKHQLVVVSGLAIGIDGVAHEEAIVSGGKTIAILGSGIDYVYPYRNKSLYEEIKKNHLLISEIPFDIKPEKENFPRRNRIIAGLSDTLLVTEANIKSGTMITVGFALDNGKTIFAVPTRIGDPQGCNYIIGLGAKITCSIEDIIEEYNMT